MTKPLIAELFRLWHELSAQSGRQEVFRHGSSNFLPFVYIRWPENQLSAHHFQEEKVMNNMQKLEYIHPVALQLAVTPSLIHIITVCNWALLFSMTGMLLGNRNKSMNAMLVLHCYLYSSDEKKKKKFHERKRQRLPRARYSNLISVKAACGKKAAKGACWRETTARDQRTDGSFQQSLQRS